MDPGLRRDDAFCRRACWLCDKTKLLRNFYFKSHPKDDF